MKKLIKRLLPLFIAAIMICALPATALAASTSGISVLVGDNLVSFANANPEAKNGRVFVPVRAIFEALGAQVSYDNATNIAAVVKGDTTVKMAPGEKTIAVTKGGSTQSIEMDVASYVLNNSLMVPVRFAAQAFGCKVGWDSVNQTAIILDVNGLLSNSDAQYTLMDKYLAYSNKFSTSYAISGTFKISVEINNDGTMIPVVSSGTINAIYDSKALNFDLDMALDLTALVAALGDDGAQDAQTALIVSMLKNINVEYILNIEEGMMYFRCSLVSAMMGATADTWYSIDLKKLLAESGSGSSYTELIAENQAATSFTDAINTICSAIELDNVQTGVMLTEALTLINTTFSDAAFDKSGDTYTTSMSVDEAGTTALLSLSLTVKDDAVVGYNLIVKAAYEEMTMDMNCSMDANNKLDMTINMNMPETMKLSCTLAFQCAIATKAAAVAPEAGSTIVSLDPSEVVPAI